MGSFQHDIADEKKQAWPDAKYRLDPRIRTVFRQRASSKMGAYMLFIEKEVIFYRALIAKVVLACVP